MLLAILSDVHANLPALEAVLDATRSELPDAYLCAGDLVGYGAFPNECIEVVEQLKNVVCVAGNHDLIAAGMLGDEGTIRVARETLAWTTSVLSQGAVTFLRSLPIRTNAFGIVMAHGSLTDPRSYVRTSAQIAGQLRLLRSDHLDADVLVLGHTHRAGVWSDSGAPLPARASTIDYSGERPVLLNPGSVGQSRELRVHASYMLLDTEARRVRVRRVQYDVERCRTQLARAGLPRDTYHLPFWRTTPRLAPARRLARRLLKSSAGRTLRGGRP